MPRTPRETRQLFDRWAQTYDTDLVAADGPLMGYLNSLSVATEQFILDVPASVIDIGVGTGNFAARIAGDGIQVHGVDISPEMLQQCKNLHPEYDLREGSFTSIPYPDASFDAAISAFTFHEVSQELREPAMNEVARVLRPGGRLCIVDIMFASLDSTALARRDIGDLWDPDESYPLVGDFDATLLRAGFEYLRWNQTGPYHWLVTGVGGVM